MKKALLSAAICAVCVPTFASTLFSTGFESGEGYTNGAELGSVSPWNILSDPNSNASAYTVTNAQAHNGSQSVTIDTAPNFDGAWAWVPLSYDPNATSEKILQGSVSLFLTSDPDNLNSLFGLIGYDSTGTEVGGMVVDNTDLFLDDQTGSNAGGTFALNEWHTLSLQFNYNDNSITGLMDGNVVATSTFDGTTVTDFDLLAFPTGFNAGFFDDYSVTTSPVPEPASMAVLGLGALALIRRRKK